VRRSRILVVDDEKYVRGLLCDVLTAWGYEVDTVADGREGLRLLVERAYDLVVTDLHMPGVNGLDLIKTVRLRGLPVPMIMLTASVQDATSHSERLDFELVPKPVLLQDLEVFVRRALRDGSVVPPSSVSLP
jgi:DNA-binding response OmpR family regulator